MSEINKPRQFYIVDSSQLNDQPTRVYKSEPKWLIGAVEWTHVIELVPMLKMMEESKAFLDEIQNYLHFNTDNLCGDNLVGDQKFTKRFNEIISKIDEEIKSYQAFKRENGLE